MLSQKKKNIYIGVIAICVVGIIIVFSLNSGSITEAPLPLDQTQTQAQIQAPANGESGKYSIPQVFPNDRKFDLSIFNSSTFQALNPIGEISLQEGELGNENPF